MGVFEKQFPLGLGTTRLPVHGPDDIEGIENAIQLVTYAIEHGVDYVDVGYHYAAGMALSILKEAFKRTNKKIDVTAKVMYDMDKTADAARKRVENYLNAMGLEKGTYFTCWTIWNYEIFEQIIKKGGVYEGAVKLKEEGIVDHICCSLHTSPEEAIKIIESGLFEGVTLSYSLLNSGRMIPVLDAAYKNNVSVAVMNPLGGGIIPKNLDFFSFACGEYDEGNTVHAALRFAMAHPAVDMVLGGAANLSELKDSLSVFSKEDPENPLERHKRVVENTSALSGFCTGCKYCEGCPKGIPTSSIMQARNTLLFETTKSYNREGPEELLKNLQIFRKLFYDDGWLPETGENPCVKCNKCENNCTQKLGIKDAVADVYRRAKETHYTKEAHIARIKELTQDKKYNKIGLYPNGGFSKLIIDLHNENIGEPDFEWLLFNSDPKTWGSELDGRVIHGPDEIPDIKPDKIIICTYKFDEDIYADLKKYEEYGIEIVKLHRPEEMPWVF